jgi:glutathione synthase/RimK-type ligase-like ATP-grasp enzyme
MKIAYITYRNEGQYGIADEENIQLLQFLQQKGLNIHKHYWNDTTVHWQAFDLVLLKAPWDYMDHIDAFHAWLDTMAQLGIPMLNPVETVRWNSDKHYLQDIAHAGLTVTPTFFLEKGTEPDLSVYFNEWPAMQLVVKPCVSGGAKNTFCFGREEVRRVTPVIHALLQDEAFMVQPFLEEIKTAGEWSLLFFNGRFSHALVKKPAQGDFRVQYQFGGTDQPQQPDAAMLEAAGAYVQQFAGDCLYARVDGTVIDGRFHLMELELIEPFLFLHTRPDGFEHYYKALQEAVRQLMPAQGV